MGNAIQEGFNLLKDFEYLGPAEAWQDVVGGHQGEDLQGRHSAEERDC